MVKLFLKQKQLPVLYKFKFKTTHLLQSAGKWFTLAFMQNCYYHWARPWCFVLQTSDGLSIQIQQRGVTAGVVLLQTTEVSPHCVWLVIAWWAPAESPTDTMLTCSLKQSSFRRYKTMINSA